MSHSEEGLLRITVLLDKEDMLVVDKPAGVACIPGRNPAAPHLLGILTEQLGCRLFVVHRLDAGTSGVLAFARTPAMHRWLSIAFQEGRIRKEYAALVHGELAGRGRIDSPLRVFGSGRVAVDRDRGKPCITEYEALGSRDGYSLLLVHPLTGRQHQIRAHLCSIGHPVAGDPRYGARSQQSSHPRLMLHAWRIDVPMPDGPALRIESPLPEEFRR